MRRIIVCSHMLLSSLKHSEPAVHSWVCQRSEGLTAEMIGVGLLVPCLVSSLPLDTALGVLDLFALAGWSGLMAAAEQAICVAHTAATHAAIETSNVRMGVNDIFRHMRSSGRQLHAAPALSALLQPQAFLASVLQRMHPPRHWGRIQAQVQARFLVAHVYARCGSTHSGGAEEAPPPPLPASLLDDVHALLPESIRQAAKVDNNSPEHTAAASSRVGGGAAQRAAALGLDTSSLAPTPPRCAMAAAGPRGRSGRLDAQFTCDSCPILPPFQGLMVPCAAWQAYKPLLRPMRRASAAGLAAAGILKSKLRMAWSGSTHAPAAAPASGAVLGAGTGLQHSPREPRWNFHSSRAYSSIHAMQSQETQGEGSTAHAHVLRAVVARLHLYVQDAASLRARIIGVQRILQGHSAAATGASRKVQEAVDVVRLLKHKRDAAAARLQDLTMGSANRPAPSAAGVRAGAEAVLGLGQALAAMHEEHKTATLRAADAAALAQDAAAVKGETADALQQLTQAYEGVRVQLWQDIAAVWATSWTVRPQEGR